MCSLLNIKTVTIKSRREDNKIYAVFSALNSEIVFFNCLLYIDVIIFNILSLCKIQLCWQAKKLRVSISNHIQIVQHIPEISFLIKYTKISSLLHIFIWNGNKQKTVTYVSKSIIFSFGFLKNRIIKKINFHTSTPMLIYNKIHTQNAKYK